MTTQGGRSGGRFPLRLEQMAAPRPASDSRPGTAAPDRVTAAPASTRPLLRPQKLLQQAAADGARRSVPAGLGLDSVDVRRRMVERLRRAGVRDERVLAAFAELPRHLFVDAALANQAYEDTSLPIGHGQTISKPSVVARMLELLAAGASAQASGSLGRVLEIGTGCGYQAALLGLLGRQVLSVERLRPLHEKARELLEPLRSTRIRLVYGDGMLGHPPNAPYDSIIAAAGGDTVPEAWLAQLAVGGRLVAPVHDAGRGGQVLIVIDRTEHGDRRSIHDPVHFVPLKSGRV